MIFTLVHKYTASQPVVSGVAVVVHINEVTLRRARLVLGWVTLS